MLRALALLAALATPAAADPLDDAVAAWVAADDATALPALAALAQGGDTRAMLFLGAIDPRPVVTDWALALDRQTRNALLRRPGGLSGQSWLGAIPAGDPQRPLADALLAARAGDPLPLLAQGQPGAAVQPLLRMFNETPGALATLSRDEPLSPTLDALVWRDARDAPSAFPMASPVVRRGWEEVAAGFATLPPESMHRLIVAAAWNPAGATSIGDDRDVAAGLILTWGTWLAPARAPDDVTPADLDAALPRARDILMAAPEAAAHRALCTPCPDAPACTLALWSAANGYYGAIWPGTPLDAFVPPAAWQGSPRQQAELLAIAGDTPRRLIADACAADIVAR